MRRLCIIISQFIQRIGIFWDEVAWPVLVDLALTFSLHSVPYIFNFVAHTCMVEWIILNKYSVAALMHYLDDFLTVGPPGSDPCARNLQTLLAVCHSLGLPLHPNKCIGSSTCLVVLGIKVRFAGEVSLPPSQKAVCSTGSDPVLALQKVVHRMPT